MSSKKPTRAKPKATSSSRKRDSQGWSFSLDVPARENLFQRSRFKGDRVQIDRTETDVIDRQIVIDGELTTVRGVGSWAQGIYVMEAFTIAMFDFAVKGIRNLPDVATDLTFSKPKLNSVPTFLKDTEKVKAILFQSGFGPLLLSGFDLAAHAKYLPTYSFGPDGRYYLIDDWVLLCTVIRANTRFGGSLAATEAVTETVH